MILSGFLTLLFGLGVGVPLFSILKEADFSSFFAEDILAVVRFTIEQASVTALFSLSVGLPLGYFFFHRGNRRSLDRLAVLYSMPALPIALAVSLSLKTYGFWTVIFAHVWINAPWVALRVAEGLRAFPESRRRAARSLGASPLRLFFDFEAPFLRTRLALAIVQVFSLGVMSFTLVLLLGGGPPVQTLETEIYSSIKTGEPDFARASVFAIWQMVLTLVPLVAVSGFRVRREEQGRESELSTGNREWVSLLLFLPLLSLLFSIRPTAFRETFSPESGSAFWISFKLSISVAIGVVLWSTAVAWASIRNRWLGLLYQIPAGVSALVLGLGFWLAYARFIDPFEGSFFAMAMIQTVLVLPLGVRILLPLTFEKNRSALDAARLMGASRFEAWRMVEWPRWRGPIRSLFCISILWSMGELAAVSLFSSENLVTLPLLVSRWMLQYRFDEAISLNLILVAVAAWVFSLGKKNA